MATSYFHSQAAGAKAGAEQEGESGNLGQTGIDVEVEKDQRRKNSKPREEVLPGTAAYDLSRTLSRLLGIQTSIADQQVWQAANHTLPNVTSEELASMPQGAVKVDVKVRKFRGVLSDDEREYLRSGESIDLDEFSMVTCVCGGDVYTHPCACVPSH